MRSRTVLTVATVVIVVLSFSAVVGLTAPDGTVGGVDASAAPSATASTPTPTPSPAGSPSPSPSATSAEPSPERAPLAVKGTWPGRPKSAKVSGGEVDWCPSLDITSSDATRAAIGAARTRSGACAAVSFVLDQRYSRLSLPRSSYRASDFDDAVAALGTATRDTFYRQRVADFVARPSDAAAERLGLVLLRGEPGPGHAFYRDGTIRRGYAGRAVWINPRVSTVRTSVDTGKATPRLVVTFSASAAVPVFDTRSRTDAMMTVPTRATLTMRREGGRWKVGAFAISTDRSTFAPLAVR